jgi:DNA-binding NarL/FixJ family response regulator
MPITLVISDDHAVVRKGIISMLAGSDVQVVAEARNGHEAVEMVLQHRPDIILMDIRMADMDGLEALEKIREQGVTETRAVILSTYDNPTYVARAVALGASDYILKDCDREQLLEAIRRVAAGQAPPDASLYGHIRKIMTRRQEERVKCLPLTIREVQVLRHIALGLSNREIGLSLDISVETVKEHVQNILRKIDATDRTQAAVWAVKQQLVS